MPSFVRRDACRRLASNRHDYYVSVKTCVTTQSVSLVRQHLHIVRIEHFALKGLFNCASEISPPVDWREKKKETNHQPAQRRVPLCRLTSRMYLHKYRFEKNRAGATFIEIDEKFHTFFGNAAIPSPTPKPRRPATKNFFTELRNLRCFKTFNFFAIANLTHTHTRTHTKGDTPR